MSNHSDAFDHWIRSSFMEINTELENLYFAQDDRADVTRIRREAESAAARRRARARRRAAGRGRHRRRIRQRLRRARQRRPVPGRAAPPRADESGARGEVAFSRGVVARDARRRGARHGAALLDRAHRAPELRARGRAQELHVAARRDPVHRREHARHPAAAARRGRADESRPARHFEPDRRCAVRRRETCARRRHRIQRPAVRETRRRALLLLRAPVLQAVQGGAPGISRRERRGLLRHQRARPAVRPVPRERSVLRAAARRQDAVHAARRPGAAARVHAAHELSRRVA